MSDLNPEKLAELRELAETSRSIVMSNSRTLTRLLDMIDHRQVLIDAELARHTPMAIQVGTSDQMVQVCEACYELGEDYHSTEGHQDDDVQDFTAVAWPCATRKNLTPKKD